MQDILKTLVNFYPVSTEQSSVKKLLQYAESVLIEAGLTCEWIEHNGIHSLYSYTNQPKHSKVLLQSHIDVVPATNQPFKVEHGRYYGRGTFDMLFAAASFLHFIKEHKTELKQLDLAILLSGDEELGGFNSVKPFLEDGYTASVCILPDAGTKFGFLSTSAKGMYNCTIKINGESHHGSRPWEGDGAGSKLVHFLTEAEKLFDTSSRDNTTMTIAKLRAGDADNQGPKEAEVILDIRYSNKTDLARIIVRLEELLQKYNGEIVLLVEGDDYQLDLTNPYVEAFIALYERHHKAPIEYMKAHGSSDARFFTAHNIPTIMLRPEGSGAHGDNEWVSVNETRQFYNLLCEYIIENGKID